MVIVLVKWYIKTGYEPNFKKLWINDMNPPDKGGLFQEFFSKSINDENPKYHTLDFESKYYTSFINVGIWKDLKSFDKAIGSFIPERIKSSTNVNKELIEVFDFEFKLRERIVMEVDENRNGNWNIPTH